MSYVWQSSDWPCFFSDPDAVRKAYEGFLDAKQAADAAFSLAGRDSDKMLHSQALADEIVSSLAIEGEHICFDSVYSSVSRRLGLNLDVKGKTDAYADGISELELDAVLNHGIMSIERLDWWHELLFKNAAGIRPKRIGEFRNGPEYILRTSGKNSDLIYEAVPADCVRAEMDRLIVFINSDNDMNPLEKSATAALRLVAIHPYGDGNGRISRAISDYVLASVWNDDARVLSMSSLILKHRNDYYSELNAVTAQSDSLDLTRWIIWNIDLAVMAENDAVKSLKKSLRLSALMRTLDPSLFNSREITMMYKLADGSFFGKLTNEKWVKMNKCSPAAALRDLKHLVSCGLLIESGDSGPKSGYYLNPELCI